MRAPPLASAVAVATGSVIGNTKRESMSPAGNPETVATTFAPTAPWAGLSDSGGCAGTVKATFSVVISDGGPWTVTGRGPGPIADRRVGRATGRGRPPLA